MWNETRIAIMDKQDRSAFDAAVRADLTYLRKGRGLTANRLATRPALMHLLDTPTDPETSLETLVGLIDRLGEGEERRALRGAFGLDADGNSLGARRKVVASRERVGSDTLRAREDDAITELLLLILLGAAQSPDAYQFYSVGFLVRRLSVDMTIHDDKATSIQSRQVVALGEGLSEYQVGHSHFGLITRIDGVQVMEQVRTRNGVIYDCSFGSPLERGETRTFVVHAMEAFDYANAEQPFTAHTFHEPTVFFDLTVRFATRTPHHAWWFTQLHPIEVPGSSDDQRIAHFRGNVAQRRFEILHGGFCSGLAWMNRAKPQ